MRKLLLIALLPLQAHAFVGGSVSPDARVVLTHVCEPGEGCEDREMMCPPEPRNLPWLDRQEWIDDNCAEVLEDDATMEEIEAEHGR